MDRILNKRNCPLCGAPVRQTGKNASMCSGTYKQNLFVSPKILSEWKCDNCGAEFDAEFRICDGRPLVENKSAFKGQETLSVEILGERKIF